MQCRVMSRPYAEEVYLVVVYLKFIKFSRVQAGKKITPWFRIPEALE